ncbi:T3SS effector HopA1 family protein [Flavobacterium sp.]|uniref:T3SS effector HopA1 family protein n=1 Tax=Flavobacterium sp. TaxID=239 RepID=UPI003D6A4FA5
MITKTLHKIAKDFYVSKGYIHNDNLGRIVKSDSAKESIIEALKNAVYGQYYCLEKKKHDTMHTDPFFIESLTKIFPDDKYTERNWKVVELLGEQKIKVSKHGIYLCLDIRKDTLLEEMPEVNQLIGVRFSCHFPNVSPGFYLYKGKSGELDFGEGLSRVYFNLKRVSAISFTKKLLYILNELEIVFQFKILQTLSDSGRVDNSVLYFSKKDKDLVFTQLEMLYDERFFKKINSDFHLVLYPGIGYAEEPSNNDNGKESFGTHRSGIIAESLYDQLIVAKSKEISIATISAKFIVNGIHPESVYIESIFDMVTP